VQRAAEDINAAFHKHRLVMSAQQPADGFADAIPIYEVMPLHRRRETAATHIDLLPASATTPEGLAFFTRMHVGEAPSFEFQAQYAAFIEYRNRGSVGKLPMRLKDDAVAFWRFTRMMSEAESFPSVVRGFLGALSFGLGLAACEGSFSFKKQREIVNRLRGGVRYLNNVLMLGINKPHYARLCAKRMRDASGGSQADAETNAMADEIARDCNSLD
jgi:hypothetical protein